MHKENFNFKAFRDFIHNKNADGVNLNTFEFALVILDVEEDLDWLSARMPESAVDMNARRYEKNWLEALNRAYREGGKMPMPEHRDVKEFVAYTRGLDPKITGDHQKRVLGSVLIFPGLTSREIAQVCGLSGKQVSRRLPELVRRSKVREGPHRRCIHNGRYAATWWAINA
jgi:hypothetical protein